MILPIFCACTISWPVIFLRQSSVFFGKKSSTIEHPLLLITNAILSSFLAWRRVFLLHGVCGAVLMGTGLAAPVFTSEATASFTRTEAGTFSAAASGSPSYSVEQKTFLSSDFATLSDGWTLLTSAQVAGGACVLNPATTSTNGALILPKLGASSPGSFTVSFDYTVAKVTVASPASGTSFTYGVITAATGSATTMVATKGLVAGFLEASSATVPASVEVRWNGNIIGKAPVTFGTHKR